MSLHRRSDSRVTSENLPNSEPGSVDLSSAGSGVKGTDLQCSLGATWVVQPGRLWKITTSGAAESFDLLDSFPQQAMAATAHWLWLTDGKRLLRIDPANAASSRRSVPSDVEQLLANADGLVATAAHGRVIRRLDPETGEVLSSVPVGGQESAALVDGGSQLWGVVRLVPANHGTSGLSAVVAQAPGARPA